MTNLLAFFVAVVAALLMLTFSGCATATITTEHADGKQVKCSANFTSLFLSMDSVTSSACGGKSNSQGQKVDAALAEALLKALIAVP